MNRGGEGTGEEIMRRLKIEYIDINRLKPAEYNPRQATEKQVNDLIKSIERFGFVDPILVNKHKGREDTIVGGHFRVRIAKDLGIKEVPVVFVDLDEEKEKELNIRLNQNSGEWDWDLLANFEIKDLLEWGMDSYILKLDNELDHEKMWEDMPDFEGRENIYRTILVHMDNEKEVKRFAKTIGQKITDKTKFVWYPVKKKDNLKLIEVRNTSGKNLNPEYPVYIISKGRWESRLTSKALEKMNVPYHIVVEPQEYDEYAKVIDKEKILVLPFSNLGQGGIPARNWVWEHSISIGAKRHWIMDDNIRSFRRLVGGKKYYVADGTIFKCAEDFVDRYENVAMAGLQYDTFWTGAVHPFLFNTRIYSCILLDNSIKHRWRGRYNEDTDLSIRIMKDGYCTFLFYAFLAGKVATMTVKGGNTDELYKQNEEMDGRLKMARSLQKQHPDIVEIKRKWGRWQHSVDYSKFKYNKLIKKKGLKIPKGINNYGMEIIKL